MRDEEVLASSLADLDRSGDDVSTYLTRHAELSPSVQAALRAVEWVQRAPRPAPSPEFRARARRNFAARIAALERPREPLRRRLLRLLSPVPLRAVALPLAVAIFVAMGTVGLYSASAAALPNMPLYSAKLAFDELRVFAAFTPEEKARAHLAVADERLGEAQLERQAGRAQTASQLLSRYQVEEAQAEDSVDNDASSPPTRAPSPRSSATPSATPESSTPRVSEPEVARVSEESRSDVPTEPRSDVSPTSLPAAPTATQTTPRVPIHVIEPVEARAGEIRPAIAPAPSHRVVEPSAPPTSTNAPSPTSPPPPTNTAPPTSAPPPTNPAPPPTETPPHPTPTPAPALPSNPDSGVLLRLLVLQASQGDPAAAVTLDLYVKSLSATKAAGDAGEARLRVQRAALVAVFERVPATQRPTIARAIAAVDAVLASTHQSSGAIDLHQASSTPSVAPPRPHPVTRVPRLGNSSPASDRHATNGNLATATVRATGVRSRSTREEPRVIRPRVHSR